MKKIVVTISTVAVVGLGSAFFSPFVQADTVGELENKQAEIQDDRADIKASLSDADSQIADVLFELQDTNEQMERVKGALKDNRQALKETETNIADMEEEIDGLEDDIATLEAGIEERFELLKERISSYQKSGGDIKYLEVVFGSKNFSEFISRTTAVNKISNADKELIELQEEDKATVEKQQDQLDEKLEEQKVAKNELKGITETTLSQKEEIEQDKQKLEDTEKELLALKEEFESEDSSLAALEDDIRQDMDAASNPAPVVATTEDSSEEDEDNLTTLAAETDHSNSSSEDSNSDSSSNNSSSNSESSNNSSASSNNSSSNASSNSSSASSNNSKPKSSPKPPKYTGGGKSAISAGSQFIGNSTYGWGQADPAAGVFDCSGFVAWAYGQEGVSLPPQTGKLLSEGTEVSPSNMQAGDLVFFNTNGPNGHVGIYMGNGQFIGSQSSTGVAVADMSSGYWAKEFSGEVRRVK